MAKQEKKTTALAGSKTVFVTQAPEAKNVFLAGTFNGWDPTSIPMDSRNDGSWGIELELAPGSYEYKFIIDGVWSCDPASESTERAVSCVPNPFGTMNYVIEVRESAEKRANTATAP
jgi:1,4-alpha-glucan branching enzyme